MQSKYTERDVWYADFSDQHTEETPFQQKIGGQVPFFIKNENWPRNEDGCLKFMGQFVHPESQQLHRIFWDPPYINLGSGTDSCVLSIPVSKFTSEKYCQKVQEEAFEYGLAYNEAQFQSCVIVNNWDKQKERLAICCNRTDCYIWNREKCILHTEQETDERPEDKYQINYECKIGGFVSPLVYREHDQNRFDPLECPLLQIVPYSDGILDDLDLVVFYEDGTAAFDFH